MSRSAPVSPSHRSPADGVAAHRFVRGLRHLAQAALAAFALASACLAGAAESAIADGSATDPAAAPAAASRTAVRAAPTIRVLSLNLWHDKGDWPRRRALIVDELRRLRPDVIALQEVLQRDGLRNQAEDLGAALGYRVQFVSVDPPQAARRYGNALLTRARSRARDQRKLDPLDDYRTAAHARVALGRTGAVEVYATHLHNDRQGGAIRARQVASLLDFVDATRGDGPVLIAGDFNSDADSPELNALAARYRDAYGSAHPQASADPAAHTTLNPAYLPAQRIDHVFYDPQRFELVEAKIVLDRSREGVWASDHFGMLAVLRLR